MPDIIPDFEDAKNEMKKHQREYTLMKLRCGITDDDSLISASYWRAKAEREARYKRFFLVTTLGFAAGFLFEFLKR